MTTPIFLSTSQYVNKYGISKMQVSRLIRSGKIPAQKVGNNWLIYANPSDSNQVGLTKTTSLQVWAKATKAILGKAIDVERNKDRQLIYSQMHSLGLPHERSFSFPDASQISKSNFKDAIDRLGLPYWISAVPDNQSQHLERLSKLRLYDLESGWQFIKTIPEAGHYKIIVIQYPDQAKFKGTALVSSKLNGIAEFITGDRHYIMTRGFTLIDPMLFTKDKITKFSKTVAKDYQHQLFNLIHTIPGHFEFQYAHIDNTPSLTFFDYSSQNSYIEIDNIYKSLFDYHKTTNKNLIQGLPSSPGQTHGQCLVTHHASIEMNQDIPPKTILVTDAITPDMIPLFKNISAIVTDLGGVTSHPAIVCRLLKIPYICATINATERITTGQQVSLNANTGTVTFL